MSISLAMNNKNKNKKRRARLAVNRARKAANKLLNRAMSSANRIRGRQNGKRATRFRPNAWNNQRVTAPVRSAVNKTKRKGMTKITFTHSEYITDLYSEASAAHFQTLAVNPGMADSFPWLSQVAMAFESYVFNSLAFEYIPNVGTDTNGTLAMAPDYDAADDDGELTKAEILSFDDAAKGQIWAPLTMKCTAANLRRRKTFYTRNSAASDLRLTDPCQLIIFTNDQDVLANNVYGELWVHYTVTLFTPQKQSAAPQFTLLSGTSTAAADDHVWGPDTTVTEGGAAVELEKFNNVISFTQPGKYLIDLVGSSLASTFLPNTNQYKSYTPWAKYSGATVTLTDLNAGDSVSFDDNASTSGTTAYLEDAAVVSITGNVTKKEPTKLSHGKFYSPDTFTAYDGQFDTMVAKISDSLYDALRSFAATAKKKRKKRAKLAKKQLAQESKSVLYTGEDNEDDKKVSEQVMESDKSGSARGKAACREQRINVMLHSIQSDNDTSDDEESSSA